MTYTVAQPAGRVGWWLLRDGRPKMGPYSTRERAQEWADSMNAPKTEDPRTTRERAFLASLRGR